MAKAATTKDISDLPDALEQERYLESARVFAAEERLAHIHKSMQILSAEAPQALLLEGGTADERATAALYWAALLNCPSANGSPCLHCSVCKQIMSRLRRDLFFFDGSAGSIKIDDIRAMRAQLGEPPRESNMRVVVLFEGQALGEASANALLKSLEDPRPGTVFVLTAPQRERLLPTLVSRSWVLTLPWPQSGEFSQLSGDELTQVSEWARALLDFSVSGRGWMERSGRKGSLDGRLAMQLVLYCQNALKDALGSDAETSEARLTPLAKTFARLSPQERHFLNEALAECQNSLFYAVNPVLVADWLATRLYFLLAKERKAHGNR